MNHGLLIQTLDPITFSDGGESEQCFKEMQPLNLYRRRKI